MIKITTYGLLGVCDKYNKEHSPKISINVNDLGYKCLSIGERSLAPMTNTEAFYYVIGLRDGRGY